MSDPSGFRREFSGTRGGSGPPWAPGSFDGSIDPPGTHGGGSSGSGANGGGSGPGPIHRQWLRPKTQMAFRA
jgi:hypothetical protein